MAKDAFLHEWKGQIFHIGAWKLYSRPTQIVNEDTGEELDFKNVADAYDNAVVDGKRLKDLISESSKDDLFPAIIDDSSIQILSPEEMKRLG